MDWNGISWNGKDFYRVLKGVCGVLKVKIKLSYYLDRKPSVEVFEIERSLVFAECESVICMKALHLLITVHNEYLKNITRQADHSIFMSPSILLASNLSGSNDAAARLSFQRQRQDEHSYYFLTAGTLG